jgi:ArsR family transcriptional regulator, arsenate/arsenite/antimonite-responsive transcriptional repressor
MKAERMTQPGTPTGWQDYTELEKLARALADKVRLNIVRILANSQEVNVTDLTQQLLISQPLVSWHLAILRRNGLVRTRRQGRQVYCSLDVARCQQSLRQLGDVVNGAPLSPASGAASAPSPSSAASAPIGEPDAPNTSSTPGTSGTSAGKPNGARPARQF